MSGASATVHAEALVTNGWVLYRIAKDDGHGSSGSLTED